MAAAAGKKMVTLKSCDGEMFEVDEKIAMESQTIKHIIEDDCADNNIPVANVTAPTLSKVIEYCKRHVETAAAEELKAWDAEFIDVDQAVLYDLLMASNYLNIKGLLDLCCQTVADIIKGKSPEEIRAFFNIKNDFTPEEEAEIRKENRWAQ